MNMLTSLNTQLDAATHALARLEQDKSYEEAMLAQQTAQSSQSGGQGVVPQAQELEWSTSRPGIRSDLALHGGLSGCGHRSPEDQGACADGEGTGFILDPGDLGSQSRRFAQCPAASCPASRRRAGNRPEEARSGPTFKPDTGISGPYPVQPRSAGAVQKAHPGLSDCAKFYDDLLNKMNRPRWEPISRSASRAKTSR